MLDKRLTNAAMLVEATHTEQFFLWQRWSPRVSWVQDSTGFMKSIAKGNRPINLIFSFAKIDGKNIVFWDCISELQDYRVINEWIDQTFPGVLKTNAGNFYV